MEKRENQMLNFILGAVFGGFVTLFFIALVFANKNAECKQVYEDKERRKLRPADDQEFYISKDMFTEKVSGYIYKITKKSTGEFYVGQPMYVWITEPVEMSVDVQNIIENATDDLYEDASGDITNEARKELQDFVDGWCKRCGVGTTYYESHKYKVRIPWEEYNV